MNQGLLGRLGMDSKMAFGYLGVLLFMIGDGLEQGWLSSYLIDNGLTMQQSALVFSVYGLAVAVAAWLSGVLAEILGTRKAMTLGVSLFVVGTLVFLTIGLPTMNLAVILPTYALRGLGYPLFAYSFLVWLTYYAPSNKLGTAVGWFWVAFASGLNVLGAYYSSFALPILGEMKTLWSALIFVFLGATLAILLNKDDSNNNKKFKTKADVLKYLATGITIAFKKPKIGLGGIVRTINTAGAYGLVVFMPAYMMEIGFTRSEWLQIYGALWSTNVIFNLIWGVIGDKLGWRPTIMIGGVGCAIFTVALYYIPAVMGPNYMATLIVAMCFGACVAAYVPLSALITSLAPDNKGAAMSVLNLGAGLSTFIGPVIVGAFIGSIGTVGVIWIYAGLYFISAILTKFITIPQEQKETQSTDFNTLKDAR